MGNCRRRPLLLAVILLLLSASVCPVFADSYSPQVKIHKFQNGLALIVVERDDWPTVLCYRYHRVGSVNEYPGMTGAAHLLEHMMFKGTKSLGTWDMKAEEPIMKKIDALVDEIDKERAKGLSDYQKMDKKKIEKLWEQVKKLQKEQKKYIVKNEIDFLYSINGGEGLNASTGFDSTDYYINLPANRLEVWAYIESDRMKNPVFREFYSERDVVYEEQRMYANTPDGAIFDAFISNFYHASPYGHPIVGWTSDIESMRRNNVLAFLRKYYAPNNTALILVGDIKFEKAKELVGRYFGGIPAQKSPPLVFTQEPVQMGERRAEVEFDGAPRFWIGFHGPKPGDDDQYALDVISRLLSSGRSSRIHRNIIQKQKAYSCGGFNWTLGYGNIFIITGQPRDPVTCLQLEEAVYAELERLKTETVDEQELKKVRNNIDKAYLDIITDRSSLAGQLAWAQLWTGDWRNFDDREKLKAVTAEDIKRVASKYFVKTNRTVVTMVPQKKEKSETEPGEEKEGDK